MAASSPEGPESVDFASVSERDESFFTETTLDYPDADIILRSSDSREFRVIKLFIIKSSPVLDKLIQATFDRIAVPAGNEKPLPALQMSESGAILRSLLTFIFPVPPDLPPSVEETMELLSVAQKYEMSHILAHIRGSIALQDPPLICKSNALHAYSLAQKYGLSQEVAQAARLTLKFAVTIEGLEDKLGVISGDHLHELWRYHQKVQENLVSNIDGFRGSDAYKALDCLKCVDLASSGIPKWIDDYICFMARTPSSFDLLELQSALLRHLSTDSLQRRCSTCTSLPRQAIDEFWTALTIFVHGNMEQVESSTFFDKDLLSKDPISFAAITFPLPECLDISDADIVIQSSDLVDFRVRKSILSSSSQFFRDMFLLPQPSVNETIDGLPVVRLSEDAELVRALVTVLYPIPPEIPTSYERVLALLAAAQKYDMSAVQASIRAEVVRRGLPEPAGTQAFRAFAIAFSNKLAPEMGTIARLTLDSPLTFAALGDSLPLFRGSALHELTAFRKMCRDNIVSCLEPLLDIRSDLSKIWPDCSGISKVSGNPFSSGKNQRRRVVPMPARAAGSAFNDKNEPTLPSWLRDLFTEQIGELKEYFSHAIINPSSIRQRYLKALLKHSPPSDDCPNCLMVHAQDGERYFAELEQKLTNARNQVLDMFEQGPSGNPM